MPSDPYEQIPLKHAAVLTGKSVSTLRRWRREGLLEVAYEHGDEGRALVSRTSVLALANRLKEEGRSRERSPSAKSGAPSEGGSEQAVVAAVQAHLASLEARVEDLVSERERVRRENAELRNELTERNRRVEALERELNQGVRGLLGRSVRKRLGL